MIDPKNITNFNRTTAELEEFLLFCIVVAGKNSKVQAKKLELFLVDLHWGPHTWTPFRKIRGYLDLFKLDIKLMQAGLGQYHKLYYAFEQAVKKNKPIEEWTFEDLTSIHGIGPKTANFFLLHSKEGYEGVVLDTHILKWIRLIYPDAPKATPSQSKVYAKWSKVFLYQAKKAFPSLTLAEIDLKIWKQYAK